MGEDFRATLKMDQTTNSAKRLHGVLVEIRNQSVEGKTIREVLSRVFGLEPMDDIGLIRKLLLVDNLFVETEEILRSIRGIDSQIYTRHFAQARKSLVTAPLDQDSKRLVAFQGALADVVLQSVEFCGMRLAEEIREVLLPADDLAELQARINELFEFTDQADLEPRLREVSLDVLEILRSAISDYRIRGISGLEDAIERSIGKLTVYYVRVKKQGGTADEVQLERILDLIIKFETVMAKAQAYIPALTEFLPKLLGP